ncbi:MAG: hypothetical protein FWH55_01335 [Oscillospiraceae bacterium]|nr:hypothetical protein [Oscillospiraceae bacterium]
MTSKERVKNCLKRKNTDRLPIGVMTFTPDIIVKFEKQLGADGYNDVLRTLGVDVKKLKLPYRAQTDAFQEEYRRRYSRDWPYSDVHVPYRFMESFGIEQSGTYSAVMGCIFEDIEDVKPIEDYPWPDVEWLDYEAMRDEMIVSGEFALSAPDWSPIFGTLCDFFGIESAMINMKLNPTIIDAAIERITDYFYRRNQRMYETCKGLFELFYIGDDFASGQGLMISVDTFNRFFRNPLQKLIDQAKSYDLFIHEHCCGMMTELLPVFIEMGVDVVEPCQFHITGMEPAKLKREYGRDIVFYGGVNTQHTMPFGTPDQVRQEVRALHEVFSNGGFILCSDHCLLDHFPLENMMAMHEEARLCFY